MLIMLGTLRRIMGRAVEGILFRKIMNVHTEFDYEQFHKKVSSTIWPYCRSRQINRYLKHTFQFSKEEIEHIRKTYNILYPRRYERPY